MALLEPGNTASNKLKLPSSRTAVIKAVLPL